MVTTSTGCSFPFSSSARAPDVSIPARFAASVETSSSPAAATEASRAQALDELGRRLSEARSDYDSAKEFDDELFGENFETA